MYIGRTSSSIAYASAFNRKRFIQKAAHNVFWFGYARQALLEGLLSLGLKEGDEILYPETICDVTLAPCNELGLKVVYYPLNDDLSPCWEKLDRLVTPNTKAFLLVHFFGVAQDVNEALATAKKHKLFLIEDNAHGYGASVNGRKLGTFGDIGIASPRKTFGGLNGAVLWVNSEEADTDLVNTDLELEPFPYKRFGAQRLRDMGFSHLIDKVKPSHEADGENESLPFGIDVATYKKMLGLDLDRIMKSRQEIYALWAKWSSNKGLVPVFDYLPDTSNPLCFPCYAKNHDEQKLWLEWGSKHGIDVYAWPSLPRELKCEDSQAFRRWSKMLCFPINHSIPIDRFKRFLEEVKS